MYIWKTDSSVAFTYLASYQNISPAHERCVGARVVKSYKILIVTSATNSNSSSTPLTCHSERAKHT